MSRYIQGKFNPCNSELVIPNGEKGSGTHTFPCQLEDRHQTMHRNMFWVDGKIVILTWGEFADDSETR